MKKIKYLFVALIFGAVMPVNAQKTGKTLSTNWQGVRASYGIATVSIDEKDENVKYSETGSASEFSLAYSKAIELTSSSPVFLEFAPEISLLSCSDKKITGSTKNTFSNLAVAVPVNIGYLFQVGENAILSPYAGLKAKLNLTAKQSISEDNKSMDINYFDDEGGAQRLQLGGQIGCGIHLNKFYAGLSYNLSLSPLVKPDSEAGDADVEINHSSVRLTVGLNF